MTGDAPQPGETPRSEVDPWAFADPDASWWRGETDRADDPTESDQVRHSRRRTPANLATTGGTGVLLPPGYDRDDPRLDHLPPLDRPPLPGPQLPGVAEAQTAAARDVADELGRPDPAVDQPTGEPPAGETLADEATAGVERHHDQPDPFRYDLPTVAADQGPVPADAEPNVRNRPTVALDRGPVPGQPPANHTWLHPGEPLPRPTGSPATDARLEKLENSPFWLTEQERAAAPPPNDGPAHVAVGGRRRPRRATRPNGTGPGRADRARPALHLLRLGQRGAVLDRHGARRSRVRDHRTLCQFGCHAALHRNLRGG